MGLPAQALTACRSGIDRLGCADCLIHSSAVPRRHRSTRPDCPARHYAACRSGILSTRLALLVARTLYVDGHDCGIRHLHEGHALGPGLHIL